MDKSIQSPMMRTGIAALFVGTVGCTVLDSIWEITLKDGKPGFATSCFDTKECDRQAFKACAGRSGSIKYDELQVPGRRDRESLVANERGQPMIEWHFRCLADAWGAIARDAQEAMSAMLNVLDPRSGGIL
jgi:hypothetical protein